MANDVSDVFPDIHAKSDALAAELNRAKVDLIRTDLETAITFATIALQANDRAKKARNTRNARKGYDAVLHFLRSAEVDRAEGRAIAEQVDRLRALLRNLVEQSGERLR